MKTRHNNLLAKVVIILMALLAICALVLWAVFANPYKVFRAQEIKAISQYDALNDTIVQGLPKPPEGTELISNGVGGILSPSSEHGRLLRLTYSIGNLYPADIFAHYENALVLQGWQQLYFGEIIYFRNTSCIKINAYNSQHLKEYYISIWHDFTRQSFSPSLPPMWVLRFFDFGETDILTCPPS